MPSAEEAKMIRAVFCLSPLLCLHWQVLLTIIHVNKIFSVLKTDFISGSNRWIVAIGRAKTCDAIWNDKMTITKDWLNLFAWKFEGKFKIAYKPFAWILIARTFWITQRANSLWLVLLGSKFHWRRGWGMSAFSFGIYLENLLNMLIVLVSLFIIISMLTNQIIIWATPKNELPIWLKILGPQIVIFKGRIQRKKKNLKNDGDALIFAYDNDIFNRHLSLLFIKKW